MQTASASGSPIDPNAERLQHQKMEAIGQLASGIAHDFKTLLTVISGNLEMLALNRNRPHEARMLVAEAWRVTELMGQLTGNLLTYVQHGRIDCVPTNIGLLTTSIGRLLRRSLGGGIAVEIDAGPGLTANINPAQFQTALINLAVNARDAMPAGGRISIQVKELAAPTELAHQMHVTTGRYIAVSVADMGPGLSRAALGRAFYTSKPGHTGLGLMIVQEFVANVSGAVRIRKNAGCGTTVELWIPLHEE